MSGSDSFAVNLHLVPTILSSTHQGALWYLNSVALLTLIWGRGIRRRRPTPVATGVALGSIFLLAFVKAASGHAADEGDFTLIELCQLLHILSTAIWAGAILISGFLVAPRLFEIGNTAKLWGYGARLSTTVTWSLATLVVSGIYTSDRELNNSLSAVRTSTWGNILLAKLTFVAAAILLGAANRFLCLRRTPSLDKSQLVKRLLFMEALLMVCILGLSGLLGNTAPPMSDM
jgi:putative copper resistance protein D